MYALRDHRTATAPHSDSESPHAAVSRDRLAVGRWSQSLPPSGNTFETGYDDVSYPNPDDWGGVGSGIVV